MASTTQNTSIQELDTTPVTSPSGSTTPRTSSFPSSSSPSSPSSHPSLSTSAAAVAQQQEPQPLDVNPSVISNFVVTGTDASFVGYTTPTGATGVRPVQSPSLSPVSEPEIKPEPDSEPEAVSESGTAATTAQGTTGRNTVTPTTTPQAGDDNLTFKEEEEEAAEVAKKSKIKRQTEAALSVCANWLGADGRLKPREWKKEEKRIGLKQIWRRKGE